MLVRVRRLRLSFNSRIIGGAPLSVTLNCTGMTSPAKRVTLVLLAVLLFICWAGWMLFTSPFSQATLRKLVPGMSKAQVRDVLGVPTQTAKASNEETWWIYQHRYFWSFRALIVEFDRDDHLKEYARD